MRELELKFGVYASFTVPVFDEASSGVARMEKLPTQDLRATYHDTEDLRLARNNITLRMRRGEGEAPRWTLKLPVRGSSLIQRDEHDFEAVGRKIPPHASDLVTAYVRNARIDPVASIHTKRRRWVLYDGADAEVAELVDDEVSVLEGRKVVSRFRELEVEARGATIKELERIADVLRDAGASDLEPIPKAVRAMGPQATAPPDPAVDPRTAPDQPAALAVQAALVHGIRRLIDHDIDTRLGDPEGVHQMRVAARRLRSDLRTFEIAVDPIWAEALIVDLKWLADVLGEVRDADVMIERLHDAAPDLESELKPLFTSLEDKREAAREELLAALRGERYRDTIDRLIEAAVAPVYSEKAASPAEETLLEPVQDRWKSLAGKGRGLGPDSADEDYHSVRKKAKRARYAAEAVSEIFGKSATRFAAAAAAVQDVLGSHQDAIVARDFILGTTEEDGHPVSFYVAAGRLAEREDHKARSERARFGSVWKELDKKKTWGWLKP